MSESIRLIGKKRGMTRRYQPDGTAIACTVLEVEPNIVCQLKTEVKDGYTAIQLAASPAKKKNLSKPLQGHFEKNNLPLKKVLKESRVDDIGSFAIGQKFDVGFFEVDSWVDVSGRSKGKGYQGVMKRYNAAGGPAAHGSGFHRHIGSTGMRSTPGRCLPGQKQAGHMGNENVTVEGLMVIQVIPEKNILLVKGSVPGPRGSDVIIRQSIKKKKTG